MPQIIIWIIAGVVTTGIVLRPFHISEAVWAVGGAIMLVICRLILPSEALAGLLKGTNVYLFLTGMMLLAETAREEKLFDWLSAHATRLAKGSASRLFFLIYLVGIIVTIFLSNDATAIVLTPAVAAVARAAKVKQALPYLFICAFVANAASFVLPISNPANLVIYGSHLPPLQIWVATYFFPSFFSIVVTGLLLYFSQRKSLRQEIQTDIEVPELRRGGKMALTGIGITTIILLVSSALDIPLGLPAAVSGIITSVIILIQSKKDPRIIIRGISWSILLLVAGLFVIVEALDKTGLIRQINHLLQQHEAISVSNTAWGSGISIALISNLVNNLPAGLVAGSALQISHLPEIIRSAVLIGVDLGPNLSVTGSLATLLWLAALHREQHHVNAMTFLKPGSWIMPIALLCSLLALWL